MLKKSKSAGKSFSPSFLAVIVGVERQFSSLQLTSD